MRVEDLQAAKKRTFYFIGVTTEKSSIMKVFPKWAEHLGLGDVAIVGVDCALHDTPERYRRAVSFIANDRLSVGALVTTHKLDILGAARPLFDYLDPYADLLGEISCISKRGKRLCGHAKDPISSGLALESFVEEGYWERTGADLCLLGAGGSSLALTTYLMMKGFVKDQPRRIYVTNRSEKRLDEMRSIHRRVNPGLHVEYILATDQETADGVVGSLAPGSLVVNATGLGKDAPGSPVSSSCPFPERGLVWEFNYRGELDFLKQAKARETELGLTVEDGWTYFIHGWTRVIAEVFDIEIPVRGPAFDELVRIAASVR